MIRLLFASAFPRRHAEDLPGGEGLHFSSKGHCATTDTVVQGWIVTMGHYNAPTTKGLSFDGQLTGTALLHYRFRV